MPFSATTAYVNTIPTDRRRAHARGNLGASKSRLRAYMRWNAMAMAVTANRLHPADGGDLGGPHRQLRSRLATHVRRRLQPLLARADRHAMAATCCSSRATARRASTRAPSSKGGSPRRSCSNYRQEADGQGHPVVSAPVADARLLAVPDRLDGPGPADGDLPGALPQVPARPRPRRHRPSARSGPSWATARWTSPSRWARSRWPAARASTTWSSSSTATCSASTARCAATARSSRSSRACSAAPAGTSSRCCGAAAGTRCSPRTRAASCCSAWKSASTASTRTSRARAAPTCASTSSASTTRPRHWSPT